MLVSNVTFFLYLKQRLVCFRQVVNERNINKDHLLGVAVDACRGILGLVRIEADIPKGHLSTLRAVVLLRLLIVQRKALFADN